MPSSSTTMPLPEGPVIVAAVDVDDETGRWQVLADARLDGITGLAADDAVVIGFNGGCSTTGRRPIVAWDATSGTEIWRLLDRVPLSGDTAQELVHVGDGLATMMSDHRLFVLDASTGEERWSELGAFGGFDVDTDAVVADGVVLAVGATETTALDTTTGEVRWRAPITAGSDRGRVDRRCQPRGRNRPVVTRRRPARAAVQQPGSDHATDGVVMLRRDASVVAVDAATGSDLWSELADGFWVHPGEVVTSRDGALVARTPRSGDTTWTLPPAAFGQLDA